MYKRGVANRVSDNNIIANWTAHHKISQWQNLRCDEKVQWHQICGLVFNLENLINCIFYFLFKGGQFCLNLRVCGIWVFSFPHFFSPLHLPIASSRCYYQLSLCISNNSWGHTTVNGSVLFDPFASVKRSWIPLNKIPMSLRLFWINLFSRLLTACKDWFQSWASGSCLSGSQEHQCRLEMPLYISMSYWSLLANRGWYLLPAVCMYVVSWL